MSPLMRLALLVVMPVVAFSGDLCKPGQLTIVSHCCEGGLGHIYGQVVIRNGSRTACYLEGVPKIEVLDKSGALLSSKIEGNVGVNACGEGVKRMLLKPGMSAAIWIDTANMNFTENVCGQRLRINVHGSVATVPQQSCGEKGEAVGVHLSGFVEKGCGLWR